MTTPSGPDRDEAAPSGSLISIFPRIVPKVNRPDGSGGVTRSGEMARLRTTGGPVRPLPSPIPRRPPIWAIVRWDAPEGSTDDRGRPPSGVPGTWSDVAVRRMRDGIGRYGTEFATGIVPPGNARQEDARPCRTEHRPEELRTIRDRREATGIRTRRTFSGPMRRILVRTTQRAARPGPMPRHRRLPRPCSITAISRPTKPDRCLPSATTGNRELATRNRENA